MEQSGVEILSPLLRRVLSPVIRKVKRIIRPLSSHAFFKQGWRFNMTVLIKPTGLSWLWYSLVQISWFWGSTSSVTARCYCSHKYAKWPSASLSLTVQIDVCVSQSQTPSQSTSQRTSLRKKPTSQQSVPKHKEHNIIQGNKKCKTKKKILWML